MTIRKYIIILFLAAGFIFAAGIFSDFHLGDEVLHFSQARYILELNKWP